MWSGLDYYIETNFASLNGLGTFWLDLSLLSSEIGLYVNMVGLRVEGLRGMWKELLD